MQRDEVADLFEYLISTRGRFLEKGREIGWSEFTKDRGATWGSMLGVFVHMLDVEEGWWQIAVQGGSTADTPDRKVGDYESFDRLAEDNARVDALTRSRLATLTNEQVTRAVTFRWPQETARSFEKIVVHAFVDELAHVGELICLFWQLGVKPPYLDWIDFRVA